jgi:hypothetical protein
VRTCTHLHTGLSQVTEVTIRIKDDTAQFDQQQLQHLAQAFPNMQKLSVTQE